NNHITNVNQRKSNLIIDGHPITVSQQNTPQTVTGKFMVTEDVVLGRLQVGADNRLLVLGGGGKSSGFPSTAPLDSYADNDRWYDDISDGPVGAKISFKKPDGTV